MKNIFEFDWVDIESNIPKYNRGQKKSTIYIISTGKSENKNGRFWKEMFARKIVHESYLESSTSRFILSF